MSAPFLPQLSWIFAPHMISDSRDHPRAGLSVCIWGLCFFLMSSYVLVTRGASSGVCGVFPLLCEVESCREPLTAVLVPHIQEAEVFHIQCFPAWNISETLTVQTQDCSSTSLNSCWPISQCNGHVLMHQSAFHPAWCWHRHGLNC